MRFLTTAEAGKKWNVSASLVLKLAKGGRIPGCVQIGTRWMIPENAEKPADKRTREGKNQKDDNYRFPSYEYRTLSSFSPPLNEEELTLKAATEAFYGCRFTEAEKLMGNLTGTIKNKYLRINALYTSCMIDIFRCNISGFLEAYGKLTEEMEEDFPHKAEMQEYIYSIQATLGDDTYFSHKFQLQPDYEYHESFLPRLANLSAVYLTLYGNKVSESELRAHELNCIFMKNSEAYADLTALHMYLGIAYNQIGEIEKQHYHIRAALKLAKEHEIYYDIAYYYYYMNRLFKEVLSEFPRDFIMHLEELSILTNKQLKKFMDSKSVNNIYKLLNHGDYILFLYALKGMTNKEVAARLNTSVGNVGKMYSDIYSRLGIDSKAELIKLYDLI